MRSRTFGAFTLLVVVNGQDVAITCSICGAVTEATVDRREAAEARTRLHIADHCWKISQGHYYPQGQERLP